MIDNIKFYDGEENGLVIESNLEASIFNRQYRKAFRLLESIVNHYREQSSNIIAFCGDRGDGKTSAMMSFVNSVDKGKYDILENISPSHFDGEHNILELVLGQLYEKVGDNGNANYYQELMDCFAAVERCVAVMKPNSESLYDRIAAIHELSASMDLKTHINRLFKTYLRWTNKLEKEGKIIIVIDDMDYNWYGAYTMIKMIEKYLRNPHCVIVVSVRIEQLAELVKVGFEREIERAVTDINLKQIAQKYISKVIPIFNRIEMPKVRDIVDTPLTVWKARGDENNPEQKPLEEFKSVKEGVVKLIFLKTRYLFYNGKGTVSLIVPTDLRSLRQLLGLLMSMKDFKKDSKVQEEQDENEESKRLFKYYFFYTWTQQLDDEDQAFADKLVDNNDAYSINKYVVRYMQRYLDAEQKKAFSNLLRAENYSYNITIGDVFEMMDMIERNALDNKSRLIAFFVKAFYGIRLYEYYDEATACKEDMSTLHPVSKEEDDDQGPEIFKNDSWFKNTNSLQRFVNGSYFTYKPKQIMEFETHMGVNNYETFPLDCYCIDAVRVRAFLENIAKMKETEQDYRKKCLFAEFLMLCILTATDNEIEVDELKKDNAQPSYLTPFNENDSYYVFDILAPFANLINVKYTYDRFSYVMGDWYKFACENDWTILGRLKAAMDANVNHKECQVASDAIIRNAEVLTSVRERVLGNRRLLKDKSHYLKEVASFYDRLINSEMRTYPQTRGEKNVYTIKFKFLEVLSEVLREIDNDEATSLLTNHIDQYIEDNTSELAMLR